MLFYNYGKTKELADMLAYRIENEPVNAALTVIDAQAEIDALPDGMIGLSEMHEYGYAREEILPLTKETALELFDRGLPVYQLHKDGSETLIEDKGQITEHEGIFGIEKSDWQNERELRSMQAELAESGADREAQHLYGDTDKYGIYQLKDNPGLRDFHFAGTAELLKRGILSDDFREIQPGNYNLVYAGELSGIHGQSQGEKLNAIFEKFNIDHPADYWGHSLSVSDIVVLHEDGENSAHFVDSFGFTKLPDFIKVLEGVKEQEIQKTEPEEMQDTSGHDVQKLETEPTQGEQPETQKRCPAFYGHTFSYAMEHEEVDRYRDSRKLDRECKGAIEETIRQNFDGMHLKSDIVKPLAELYGSERMAFVLANTIQQESWDGRFSGDNKAWASEFFIPENIVRGMDMNCELIVSSHPAVLDGFISMFRREVLEKEKEMSAAQEEVQDTSGHDVNHSVLQNDLKSEPEQAEMEQTEAAKSEPQKEQRAPEFEDMEDGDEIIDLGDEKDQVLAEMKGSLAGDEETELAFQIADRFISIQEVDGGYDYSIMGADYKEISGGVYDNPDISIREALNDIMEDLRENPFDDSARGNISDKDELIPIDYEGLMEKVEAAEHIELQAQQTRLREKEPVTLSQGQAEPEVTLAVAECGEFHNLGEFYENIPTVEEAVAIWKQIPPERMNGIPAIGINIHTPGADAVEDVGIDILSGKRIDLDILEHIPDIKGNPQAMEVIAELVAKVMPLMPEIEIDGHMSEEMEAKVWEKCMPDLTPAERLAVEVDRFVYQYDTVQYHDNSCNMTENVEGLAEDLRNHDIMPMAEWLAQVSAHEGDTEEGRRAMELLMKVAEYKPLAKIEEMEEQNYNMVDNVLNNGAGEKARKEENKKEQECPAARTSLKARLAEKKALVSGQGKDYEAQENIKSNQREM